VWALHRTQHFWLGLPLSIPLLMSLTNMTCYYFVVFIAFASLVRLRPAIAPALLATAAGSHILLSHFYWIDDRYTALSYLFFAFALVPLVVLSRVPTVSRIQAFLGSLTGPARAALPKKSAPALEPSADQS
jgi:hypothetical protein